jgi:hypothetical protein
MADNDPIIIGQANTASNPGNETSLSRHENTAETVLVARNLNQGDGIHGEASGSIGLNIGVRGTSANGTGVAGTGSGAGEEGTGGIGVEGTSDDGTGVNGSSITGVGVGGFSSGTAVLGFSSNVTGVLGSSPSGVDRDAVC